MPDGADTVFMQEDVRIDDAGRVVLPAGLRPGANVRPAGEDISLGHVALRTGRRLRPQDIALAAAFGLTHLDVVRRLRVAVFSTGDELASLIILCHNELRKMSLNRWSGRRVSPLR